MNKGLKDGNVTGEMEEVPLQTLLLQGIDEAKTALGTERSKVDKNNLSCTIMRTTEDNVYVNWNGNVCVSSDGKRLKINLKTQ